VAAAFLAQPAESQAIFHWFSNCCGGNTTPTYSAAPAYGAAPAYQAAAADPCCAPPQVSQTVNYLPQTCYRTQYVTVPVTTYRPVTGRDPCTGCPVTCMRPATTYVQQARLVPYTTYRAVLSNPCCGAATVGYTARYSAGVSYGAAASCGGCSGAAAPITYAPANSTPYYGGTPYYGNAASSATISSPTDPASGVPTLAPPAGGSRTFGGSGSMQNAEKPIRNLDESKAKGDSEPNGDAGKASGTGGILSPRLFQPNDRTTSYPMLRAGTRPVSYRENNPPTDRPSQNKDEWRPSTR
jgi:hypothetical protein